MSAFTIVDADGTVSSGETSTHTCSERDRMVLANAAAGPLTVIVRRGVTVKKTDSTANAVTLVPPAGGGLIDNAATLPIVTPMQSVSVAGDGLAYWAV